MTLNILEKHSHNRYKRQELPPIVPTNCRCTVPCGCTDSECNRFCPPTTCAACPTLASLQTPSFENVSSIDEPVIKISRAALLFTALGLMPWILQEPPSVGVCGSAPIGVPAPGTPGGGILPTDTSTAVTEALSLVPDGLCAVAIFPPSPNQQIPALSVIFSEDNPSQQR